MYIILLFLYYYICVELSEMGNLELNRAAECNRSARAIALLTQSDEIRTECTTRQRLRSVAPPRGGEPVPGGGGTGRRAEEFFSLDRSDEG